MHKTERLVILIEPELLKKAKQIAKENFETVSSVVRKSLSRFLEQRAASQRTKRLMKLGRYHMPLRGIESTADLNRALKGKYRNVS